MTLSIQDFNNSPQGTSDQNEPNPSAAILKQLAHLIGPERFEMWFSDSTRFEIVGRSVQVSAPNNFSLQRIQTNFGSEIRNVVDRICGPQFVISYQVDSVTASGDSAAPATIRMPEFSDVNTQPTPAARKPLRPHRRGLNTFNFGDDNKLLRAGVDQLFERPGQFSPLYIYGPTGSGKSHLAEVITNDFRRRLKRQRCVFLSAEQFTSQFLASLRGGAGLPIFRRKYRELDLLAIDDIQFFAGKRATLGEFQHTIDNLIRHGKQLIVTSDRPPIELGHLGSDVSNRLAGGLTCSINYPDFDGRLKIARSICKLRNLTLSNSVLNLICEQLSRDMRRISGAINRLHAYSLSIQTPITPEIASKVLSDLFALSGPSCTSMVSIEEAVCEICGIKPTELKSPSRKKRICSARMLAMYLSRQYTGSAFSEIGDYFGGRSHSTVIAAEKKVAKWIEDGEGIRLPHAQCSAKEVLRRIESTLRIS